jgi:Zn finger protein HypA/HybF involved in hydrogenase expression
MGRKNEMKVSKAFTIGLEEAAFIAMESDRLSLKVSAFVNKLIRKAMLEALGKEQKKHKPSGKCHKCNEYRGYDLVDMDWLCEVCKTEKTEYIKAIVQGRQT